ncbi:MAG: hypothetical protein J6J60_02030 [Clostridia bacterium]|nr:hypothetical protein [Clostridia bacterium]
MKRKITIIISVILVIVVSVLGMLLCNKTFLKTTYIGVQNQEIFIPKYSFFEREAGMTCACFKSLKSEKDLKEEIDNYMKDFEYFDDETTYGYQKGNLFIQSYEVVNDGLFRRIYITY